MPYIINCPRHCGGVPFHRDYCPGCFNEWAQAQRRTAVVQHNVHGSAVVQELCCSVHGVVGPASSTCEQCVAEWRGTTPSSAWAARPMNGQELLHWYGSDDEPERIHYDEDGVGHLTFDDGEDVHYYKIFPPVTPP